jgi:hypothetical protein
MFRWSPFAYILWSSICSCNSQNGFQYYDFLSYQKIIDLAKCVSGSQCCGLFPELTPFNIAIWKKTKNVYLCCWDLNCRPRDESSILAYSAMLLQFVYLFFLCVVIFYLDLCLLVSLSLSHPIYPNDCFQRHQNMLVFKDIFQS